MVMHMHMRIMPSLPLHCQPATALPTTALPACHVSGPGTLGTNTRHHWTQTHAHAITNSCCPSLKPHPFRSKEHTTASGAPDEHTLATAPRRRPATLARLFSRASRLFSRGGLADLSADTESRHGWDGPVLWCPSAAARVGETRGKTEWLGTHARPRPEAPAAGQAAGRGPSGWGLSTRWDGLSELGRAMRGRPNLC